MQKNKREQYLLFFRADADVSYLYSAVECKAKLIGTDRALMDVNVEGVGYIVAASSHEEAQLKAIKAGKTRNVRLRENGIRLRNSQMEVGKGSQCCSQRFFS